MAEQFQSTPSARRATFGNEVVAGGQGRFQSTPSARRATAGGGVCTPTAVDFNPRPPRGERLTGENVTIVAHKISIHALREESDKISQSDFDSWV